MVSKYHSPKKENNLEKQSIVGLEQRKHQAGQKHSVLSGCMEPESTNQEDGDMSKGHRSLPELSTIKAGTI